MLTSARNPGGRGLLVTALKSRSAPVVRALLESSAFSLAQVHSLLIVTVNYCWCRRSFLFCKGPASVKLYLRGGAWGAWCRD